MFWLVLELSCHPSLDAIRNTFLHAVNKHCDKDKNLQKTFIADLQSSKEAKHSALHVHFTAVVEPNCLRAPEQRQDF